VPYTDLNALLPGGSPTTGDTVPATWFQGVQDNFELVDPWGQWTSYTPTLGQPGNVTKTVTYARWMRIGRLIVCRVQMVSTAVGITANAITVSLPVTAAVAGPFVGEFGAVDTGTANYFGIAYLNSTTTVAGLHTSGSGAGNAIGTGTAAFALASGDVVYASFMYEAAADA
jgi:hypothetical protein